MGTGWSKVIKVSIHDESGSSVHIEVDGSGSVSTALKMASQLLDRKLDTGRWLPAEQAEASNV